MSLANRSSASCWVLGKDLSVDCWNLTNSWMPFASFIVVQDERGGQTVFASQPGGAAGGAVLSGSVDTTSLESRREDAQVRLDDFAPAILAGGAFLAGHLAQGGPDRVGRHPAGPRYQGAQGHDADELVVTALRGQFRAAQVQLIYVGPTAAVVGQERAVHKQQPPGRPLRPELAQRWQVHDDSGVEAIHDRRADWSSVDDDRAGRGATPHLRPIRGDPEDLETILDGCPSQNLAGEEEPLTAEAGK